MIEKGRFTAGRLYLVLRTAAKAFVWPAKAAAADSHSRTHKNMKEKKLERSHGHGGLEPSDVALLFPDPAGDIDQQPSSTSRGPRFEGEPWPAAPIDDSAELQKDLELSLPEKPAAPIKPIGYPPRTIRRLAPLPSSSSWFMELQKILLGD